MARWGPEGEMKRWLMADLPIGLHRLEWLHEGKQRRWILFSTSGQCTAAPRDLQRPYGLRRGRGRWLLLMLVGALDSHGIRQKLEHKRGLGFFTCGWKSQ
jgi:hypothetical protein